MSNFITARSIAETVRSALFSACRYLIADKNMPSVVDAVRCYADEIERLTAELDRHKTTDLECVQVIDRLTKERDDEHLACHEAREAARFLLISRGREDDALARWKWLEE